MNRHDPIEPAQSTRRDFLRDAAFGLPAIAAADLLLRGGHLEAAPPTAPRRPARTSRRRPSTSSTSSSAAA